MDMAQLAQTVAWLQEERRRDRLEVERLTQQLEALRNETLEQANWVKDVESRLAAVHNQLSRALQVEASVERAKKEVASLIDAFEQRVQQTEREASVLRHKDREAQAKAFEALRLQVQQVERYDEEIGSHHLELQRLNERIVQLQSSLPVQIRELADRVQGLASIEDMLHRNDRHIQHLQTLAEEVRQQLKAHSEAIQLADVERQRQVTQLQNEIKLQRQVLEKHSTQVTALQEQGKEGKQALDELRAFKEYLQKQQEQVAELQRLAEERQKRELGEWQADNEKRWKRLETLSERRWAEQRDRDQDLAQRLRDIESQLVGLSAQIELLWQAQRAFAYHQVSEIQKWMSEFEKIAEQHEKIEPAVSADGPGPVQQGRNPGATAGVDGDKQERSS